MSFERQLIAPRPCFICSIFIYLFKKAKPSHLESDGDAFQQFLRDAPRGADAEALCVEHDG